MYTVLEGSELIIRPYFVKRTEAQVITTTGKLSIIIVYYFFKIGKSFDKRRHKHSRGKVWTIKQNGFPMFKLHFYRF